MRLAREVLAGAGLAALGAAWPLAAHADDSPPVLSLALRETVDGWAVATGAAPGHVLLNKLQVSGTIAADRWGLPGWSVHAQIYRTDGDSLSARLGDIQTADNIEAPTAARLFEAWLQKSWGSGDRVASLRFGLLDYNADFDSTDAASLFLNSSHGIGPDVSKSGRNGPSIFPVSGLGLRASWSPNKAWTFRLAAYDGVPGDPARPAAFVVAEPGGDHGALLAAQADWQLTDKSRVEVGGWRYTVPLPDLTDPARRHTDQGSYASITGPLSQRLTGYLRVGIAESRVQPISAYLGGGLVLDAPLANRPDDRLGLAVSHAVVSGAAAETTIETSYLFKVSDRIAVQPDIQYVLTPSGNPAAPDALAFGLRLVFTTGYPKKAPATQQSDPTVPPDGPQPPDSGTATPG